MKYLISFFLISLLFSSCKKINKQKLIIGNWSVITIDSTYHEVRVDSFNFDFYNYETSFWPLRPYFIENDSIRLFASEKSKKYYTYNIDWINKYEIVLNNEVAQMRMLRIDTSDFTFDKINNFEKDKFRFEIAHLNRRNKLLGINQFYDYDSLVKIHKEMEKNKPQVEKLKLPDYLSDKDSNHE